MTHKNTGMSKRALVLLAKSFALLVLVAGAVTVGRVVPYKSQSQEKTLIQEWIKENTPGYRRETWEQRTRRLINANLREIDQAGGIAKVRDRQVECLAKNIYFESRGQPLAGQVGVAMVTLNRLEQGYERTVCGVVKQRMVADVCQFSWVCEGPKNRPAGYDWRLAVGIAITALENSNDIQDPTNGATHFHATHVRPDWARVYTQAMKIGDHIFYKR
jgi:spore germination cell wall hydrolase CwlJ-like protein